MRNQVVGVCWLLTTKCNLSCPMCYRFVGDLHQIELRSKHQIAHRIVEEGIRKVTFAGGEPLLDRDLPDLVRQLNQQGVKTALCTNGELLTEARLVELAPFLDELTVAVDGSTPKIHGAMRSSPANFEVSLRLLQEVQKYSVSLDISTVVTRVNLHDLENIRDIVFSSGIHKWKVFQFYPLMMGAKNRAWLEVSAEEFTKVQALLASHRGSLEIDFRDAREETMRSYLHISQTGRLLIVKGGNYRDIGSVLECKNLVECLEENGFSFEIHRARHWRDGAEHSMVRPRLKRNIRAHARIT